MQKKVTALDVAKIADVSPATVSMILNNKNNVSFTKTTVNNVEHAAKLLGYKVPANKKKELEKKEKIIVVIVSNMTNPYYLMLLQGTETYAAQQGYSIFLCNIYHDEKIEEHYLKMISNMRISGIIYMCNPSQKCMKLLEIMVKKNPIVIVNNKEKEVNIDSIEINNNKLGQVMAEHLLTLGHKYVGYIATSLKNNQKQRYRCVEGFVETFQGADKNNCVIIKTPDDTEVGGKTEYDIGYRLAQQLINENKKLTAIVGMNDVIALGIYDALEDANYRIPTDMSVMGCDNTLISEIKRISLTTVEHFILCKGMDACEFLLKKVMLREKGVIDSNISSTYHVEYVPRIVIRSTTDHPRKNEK